MSIPTPFNPLGTLGKGGYISNGLVLCVLSEHERGGDTLTNLVDGTVYQSIAHTQTDAGSLSFTSIGLKTVLPRGAVQFSPQNTIELIAHVKEGSVLFDCYLESHTQHCGLAAVTAKYGQVSRNTSNDRFAWRSHIGEEFFDRPCHFCLNSDNSSPVWVNADAVSVITDSHSWSGQVNSVMSFYDIGNVEIFAIRIYNRALTRAEIEHNYKLDKKKYSL